MQMILSYGSQKRKGGTFMMTERFTKRLKHSFKTQFKNERFSLFFEPEISQSY